MILLKADYKRENVALGFLPLLFAVAVIGLSTFALGTQLHKPERLLRVWHKALRSGGASALTPGLARDVVVSWPREREQTLLATAGEGFLSAGSAEVFYGLPAGSMPKDLEVRWPDGDTTTYTVPDPLPSVWLLERQE